MVVPPSWSIRPPRSGKVAQGDDRLDERLLQAVTEVLRAVAQSWSHGSTLVESVSISSRKNIAYT